MFMFRDDRVLGEESDSIGQTSGVTLTLILTLILALILAPALILTLSLIMFGALINRTE